MACGTMTFIRRSLTADADRVVQIWRDAVDATHDFLTPEDRGAIDDLICGLLPSAPLWVVADREDRALAFMLIVDGHLEALFVDPAHHGAGIGSALVRHGLARHPAMTVDVNEQNGKAVGFYEKLGFRHVGRSALDGQGRPYPLLHLVHVAK